ncbi:serine/threonine protein kinase [Aerosakkonemataceae cyanobacterium BLCC-F154]|uniref:Serine/threonine protein kinase n=1 Tax=Floridaenema fluviatile BLCC-F154 TaxID=3153640 RepID=A0ABV4YK37_9CYAN
MIAPEVVLVDRYQLTQRLGNKGGRQTWLARDLLTQQKVVVKLLCFYPDFEWVDLKLFEREAEILRSLNHPRIPRYLDYLDLDLPDCRGFALIQTYIAAQSLEQYLAAGRLFSETELQQIAASILQILVDLHRYHPPIVHRDIKPSNILLGDRSGNHPGQVYLVDFGAVKGAGQPDGSITIAGTYGYMPPEQLHGQATPASDLYSLGMTLIRVLTGTLPETLLFEDKDTLDLPPGMQINSVLLSWLKWMTRVNPSRRPQSAKVALQALNAVKSTSLNRATEWQWQDDRWIPISQSGKIKPTKTKPKSGRVRLYRSEDTIAIDIPPNWLAIVGVLICTMPTVLVWNKLLWPSFIREIAEGNMATALVMLPFILIALFMNCGMFILFLCMSSRIRLYIDRDRLTETTNTFGFRSSSSLLRTALTKLYFYEDSESAFLSLSDEYSQQKYTLSHSLSQKELRWLAQELSDFLGIPITKSEK